jgi:hypothetical protein
VRAHVLDAGELVALIRDSAGRARPSRRCDAIDDDLGDGQLADGGFAAGLAVDDGCGAEGGRGSGEVKETEEETQEGHKVQSAITPSSAKKSHLSTRVMYEAK